MRKVKIPGLLWSLVAITIQPIIVFSQNVGIGTVTPAFKLDVRDGSINTDSVYRIGGNKILSIHGSQNLFVGTGSGNLNTTGANNTVVGNEALSLNTFGGSNTAIGFGTLNNNTTGMHNSATGAKALYSNTTGFGNTATGSAALYHNTSGFNNTATGIESLHFNVEGWSNSALGHRSLFSNTSGSDNTAIGFYALSSNTTGYFNSAIGSEAMDANSTGSYNTAVGYRVFNFNLTGSRNTAVGCTALASTTASELNTVIGWNAGYQYNMGWNNTIVGAEAGVSFNNQYNSIVIGNVARATDVSKVRIGNSANWSYEAFANWTNISDSKYKKNVRENVPGLAFIIRLRPVTYQMDVAGLSKKFNEGKESGLGESMKKAIADKEEMVWTGFLAQEVEAAAKETGFDFSGVDKPRNDYGVYGLRYAEFVVPLVKAVQELSIQNDELLKRIEKLESLLKIKN